MHKLKLKCSLVQLKTLILHVFEELLRSFAIFLFLFIGEQIIWYQLVVNSTAAIVDFLALLLCPDVVRIFRQTFGHILHFSVERQIGHIDRMWIVVECIATVALKILILVGLQ